MARRPDAAVLLPALAGLLLAIVALSSLIAAFEAQPAEPVLSALRSREPVDGVDAAEAAHASLRAAGWFERGRYLTDAALASSAAGDARDGLPDMGTTVRDALAARPASPHNWTRLAIARRSAGDRAGAMRAWEMAVLTGRYVPGLMVPRLEAGLQLLPAAGPTQIELLGDQVRLTAAVDIDALARLAARRKVEPFVRAALMSAPDLSAAYEAADRAARS